MDGSFPPASQAGTAGRLMPRQPVPALRLRLLDGGIFDLSERTPQRFSMVVFYRGLHCPVCTTYLRELERLHGEFVSRGIETLMASSDTAERAAAAQEKWRLPSLTMAHSLLIPVARQWGLYVSTSRGRSTSGVEEPPVFSEPCAPATSMASLAASPAASAPCSRAPASFTWSPARSGKTIPAAPSPPPTPGSTLTRTVSSPSSAPPSSLGCGWPIPPTARAWPRCWRSRPISISRNW